MAALRLDNDCSDNRTSWSQYPFFGLALIRYVDYFRVRPHSGANESFKPRSKRPEFRPYHWLASESLNAKFDRRCRWWTARDLTSRPRPLLLNIALPHWSNVSQRHFCIILFNRRRTAFIPSTKLSSSASFRWDRFRHRSEARAALPKPKNNCLISFNVKPSCRAR